jgi:hypothetical protein
MLNTPTDKFPSQIENGKQYRIPLDSTDTTVDRRELKRRATFDDGKDKKVISPRRYVHLA